MPETTPKSLLFRRVAQLLLTEGLSLCFFLSARTRLGGDLALRLGLFAPLTLAFFPIWALRERSYVGVVVTLLVNIAFALGIGYSVLKNRKWLGGLCLFAFNLVSFVLSLNY